MIKAEGFHAYDNKHVERQATKMGYQVLPFVPVIDSTMTAARAYALDRSPLPAVVYTDHQTAGVGRSGRQWHDNAGTNIMATVVVDAIDHLVPILADLVGDDLCETVREVTGSKKPEVKYPNDLVVVTGKKIEKLGGILARNEYDTNVRKPKYIGTSIGFGINVGSTPDGPTDYPPTSTDLLMASLDLPSVRRQDVLLAALRALRYIAEATEIYDSNPASREHVDTRHSAFAAILGESVTILRGDAEIKKGEVIDTKIGWGILIVSSKGKPEWFSMFDNDMKVRVN